MPRRLQGGDKTGYFGVGFVVQEDMEKVTARFKEHLEQKKKERQGVQGTLQQTKVRVCVRCACVLEVCLCDVRRRRS